MAFVLNMSSMAQIIILTPLSISAGAIGPLRMLQSATERWKVGATDIELFAIVVTNSADAGTARIEATYLQDYWNDSARPV